MITEKICGFPDCIRPHFAKGWCNAHWQQWKYRSTMKPLRTRRGEFSECSFPDCHRRHDSSGYCQTHIKQLRAGKPLSEVKTKIPQSGKCFLPNCEKDAKTGGYCLQHRNIQYNFDISKSKIIELFSGEIKCGICGTLSNGNREFHIDHDHSCCRGCDKCVRGLLCGGCNHGLGNFRDRIDIMESAISYLRRAA